MKVFSPARYIDPNMSYGGLENSFSRSEPHWPQRVQEIHMNYAINTQEACRKYTGNTQEIQRIYTGNTQELHRKYREN